MESHFGNLLCLKPLAATMQITLKKCTRYATLLLRIWLINISHLLQCFLSCFRWCVSSCECYMHWVPWTFINSSDLVFFHQYYANGDAWHLPEGAHETMLSLKKSGGLQVYSLLYKRLSIQQWCCFIYLLY